MKNILHKYLLAAGVFAMALAGPSFASAKTVKVCVEGAYPPFSAISPSGKLVGFDIDMANALVKKMGATPVLVKVDWDGIIPALLAKKCDAIIASMSITEERKKKISFTDKYYGNPPLKFIGKKGKMKSDSRWAFRKKTVGVQRATIAEEYMKKKYPKVKLRSYATQDEANADLVSGRVDAVFQDYIPASEFLKTSNAKDLTFFGKEHTDPAILGIGTGIGVRKEDTALRDDLSKAIKGLRRSGEYKKINKKYFAFDIYK